MRQKIFPALLLFLLCFASGCSQKNLDLALDSCVEYIMNTVIFEDTLEELDRDVIRWRYNVEEDVDARVFAGSGATAEEVCVMQAIDDDSASDLVSLLEQHVQDQRESYENYQPEEVQRIDHAFLKRYGDTVVLIIGNDNGVSEKMARYVEQGGV